MISSDPTIIVPVDLTNPGHFFACCGLLELADRFWQDAEGWFCLEDHQASFRIAAAPGASLHELLNQTRSIQFDAGDGEAAEESIDDEESERGLVPIIIDSPVRLVLDWWSEKSLKPWAGSMNERLILRAMLRAIDPANPDPLNDSKVVLDPVLKPDGRTKPKKPKKREPFYFDCRRGCNAHPLDSGFSPDAHHFETNCFPAVEALSFIGLQRMRPSPGPLPNRSQYTVWTQPLPITVIPPIACGLISLPGSLTFTFDNFFRTDQRKHKSYSRATRIRRNHAN